MVGENPARRNANRAIRKCDVCCRRSPFSFWRLFRQRQMARRLDHFAGEWTRPDCAGHRPSRRSGHTLTALPGNRIALFGGLNQAGSLNDLHVLSICDMIWEQVNLTECLPPKVYRHTANVLHAGPDFTFLLILGGKQGQNFRDGKVVPCCFIVDICTGISAKVSGFAFSRAGHTTSCLKSDDGSTTIYVHGGGTGISDPHLFFKWNPKHCLSLVKESAKESADMSELLRSGDYREKILSKRVEQEQKKARSMQQQQQNDKRVLVHQTHPTTTPE
ncbi:uncharacterized protein [Oscarella lobularis]|uniref:uncharacterized protein isoform X3 n=1 Tax=Oscarella lobularis TaxID=121494 RepID=UPI003313FC98